MFYNMVFIRFEARSQKYRHLTSSTTVNELELAKIKRDL